MSYLANPPAIPMEDVVMLGTAKDTMGGISSVVRMLEAGGLFARCPIHYIETHTDGSVTRKLWIAARAWIVFLSCLMRGKIALLHVHLSSRASFWRKSIFIWPALFARIPVVLHLHGSEFHIFYEQECGPLRRWLVQAVFSHAARVVVLSESWRAWVQRHFPAARVQVVYNPVVLPDRCSSVRAAASVLFLGRLGDRKGVFHLIAAAARLAGDFPGLRLWLGGDGEVEKARELARELGIEDRVELLGWISGAEKEERLRQAAVFVLPSYNEGLPMAVLEAMAHGLPVITTPVGGIPEAITDGVEGFLVLPGDEAALADRLRQLLSDSGLRQRMGEAARRKVEQFFSTDVVVPQFEALYVELLAGEGKA